MDAFSEIIVSALVIAVVGFAIYTLYERSKKSKGGASGGNSPKSKNLPK
jgi:hypothetical protein